MEQRTTLFFADLWLLTGGFSDQGDFPLVIVALLAAGIAIQAGVTPLLSTLVRFGPDNRIPVIRKGGTMGTTPLSDKIIGKIPTAIE